jgi:hypothetical protein
MIDHIRRTYIIVWVILASIFTFQCGKAQNSPNIADLGSEITPLTLTGEIAERYAEISGLTWYKDQLILLPQYPDRFISNEYHSLFRISKQDIYTYLDQATPSAPISVKQIQFDEKEIPGRLPGFQGYESIVFVENRVYLTMEINLKGAMQSYLIEGSISENMAKIELDETTLELLPIPLQIKNYACEAMTIVKDRLLVFYEANGSNITSTPQMVQMNLENGKTSVVPFLNIEYRLTDATEADENGKFWVCNYYYPGDFSILNPAPDSLADRSGSGQRFSKDKSVERLIEMQYHNDTIKLSDSVPIYLNPDANGDSRNWEGLVRLDDRGFILVTDKHPKTILAFLPYSYKDNKGHRIY